MSAQRHFTDLTARCLTSQLAVIQEQRYVGKEESGAPHQHNSLTWVDRVSQVKSDINVKQSFI